MTFSLTPRFFSSTSLKVEMSKAVSEFRIRLIIVRSLNPALERLTIDSLVNTSRLLSGGFSALAAPAEARARIVKRQKEAPYFIQNLLFQVTVHHSDQQPSRGDKPC